MQMYRIYCFDGGSRIVKADWLEAVNDAVAVHEANNIIPDCFRVEVWQRERLVGRIDRRNLAERRAGRPTEN